MSKVPVNAMEPLVDAARNGDVKLVGSLLASGVNVDKRDSLGQTPLHLAAGFDRGAVVQLLLEAKATLIRKIIMAQRHCMLLARRPP